MSCHICAVSALISHLNFDTFLRARWLPETLRTFVSVRPRGGKKENYERVAAYFLAYFLHK